MDATMVIVIMMVTGVVVDQAVALAVDLAVVESQDLIGGRGFNLIVGNFQ
jgi:hypothetical protein